MARTKSTARLTRKLRTSQKEIQEMKEFEQKMRKYYPKKSRFYYNGFHYQPNQAENFNNPNSLVAQRYKRDFFRSFYAASEAKGPKLSHVPQNLKHLMIWADSLIVVKKLIKQNKRLEHIVFSLKDSLWADDKRNDRILKCLKYSRSLRSVKFQSRVPKFTEAESRKIGKSWGRTIEKIDTVSSLGDTGAMENILRLPSLKEFKLRNFRESFPYAKLQERTIPYSISFGLGSDVFPKFQALTNSKSQFKLSDYVNIRKTDSRNFGVGISEKMFLEKSKIERNSKQKHFLLPGLDRYRLIPPSLCPVFQNISSLDLTVSEDLWNGSELGQLKNLRHLSIHMCDGDVDEKRKDKFGSLLKYLKKNVAPYKKLETFLIKAEVREEEKLDETLASSFFEACSESLRKVHFEFKYQTEESEDAECFYQGLSKLKNLHSLGLFLNFGSFKAHKTIEKLCQSLSEIKSLEELDFNIQKDKYQGKPLNVKFPTQLKRLSLKMDTSGAPFDFSTAIWPLSNLVCLELEFLDFTSPKWSKMCDGLLEKLKLLERLIMKKTQETENRNKISNMKERFDGLMKGSASSSLKLCVFADMESREMMIFRRKTYSWSDINPIIDAACYEKDLRCSYIKSYS